jgi:hypothetical protein
MLPGDVAMTATYERQGVSFLYPENWNVADESDDGWPRTVSVESPEGGYWALHIYPPPFRPDDLCEQALAAMQAEYEGLEFDEISEEIFEHHAVGFDLSFFCLDFLVTCRIRSFRAGGHAILLISQAESREFDRQQPVYAALTKSFLDHWG